MKKKITKPPLKNTFFLYGIYGFSTLVLISAAVFCYVEEIPFGDLSRDPNSITSSHSYYGAISNLGVLFWSFSAAVCLYTYYLFSDSMFERNRQTQSDKSVLLWGGIISVILLLDDLFLLHEVVFKVLFSLDEKVTFAIYGIILSYYLFRFRKFILRKSPFVFLLFSFFFFGLSLFFDFLPRFTEQWHHAFEDAPKFLGIVSWFVYQFISSKIVYGDLQETR